MPKKHLCSSALALYIYGTVRPIARPTVNHRIMYSGHKRVHCLKFQVCILSTCDIIITIVTYLFYIYFAVSGHTQWLNRPHVWSYWREAAWCFHAVSQWITKEAPTIEPTKWATICTVRQPGIWIITEPPSPFHRLHLTPPEQEFNQTMSSVCVSVEWAFWKIIHYFAYLDFKKIRKSCCNLLANITWWAPYWQTAILACMVHRPLHSLVYLHPL